MFQSGSTGCFWPPQLPTTRLSIHNKPVAHLHGHRQGGGKGAKLTETSVDLISRDVIVPPPENKLKKKPCQAWIPTYPAEVKLILRLQKDRTTCFFLFLKRVEAAVKLRKKVSEPQENPDQMWSVRETHPPQPSQQRFSFLPRIETVSSCGDLTFFCRGVFAQVVNPGFKTPPQKTVRAY